MRSALVVVRWATVAGWAATDALPLSGMERHRIASMRREDDRARFLAARRLLRATVADVTGTDPSSSRLEQRCDRCGGEHGRPTVAVDGHAGPSVSLAHAGGVVVVAVASRPVGVDIEPAMPVHDGVKSMAFTPAERARHAGDCTGLLRTWVRKEAILKATGDGLLVDPSALELTAADEPPILRRWAGRRRPPRVAVQDFEVAGHVAAVAAVGRGPLTVSVSPAEPAAAPA